MSNRIRFFRQAILLLVAIGALAALSSAQRPRRPREQFTSLNGIRFADEFPGATVTAQIDACLADISVFRDGTCVIPASMGPGVPTSVNSRHLLLDLRSGNFGLGRLNGIRVVDGNTFPTIQSAIADVPASGGIVFIPPGTFQECLENIDKDLVLAGSGREVTTLDCNQNESAITSKSTGTQRIITIQNMSIRSTFPAGSRTKGNGVSINTQVYDIATGAGLGASRTSNVVTIRTASAHSIVNGNEAVISGVADSSFNGTFTITSVPTSATFTYAQVAGDATSQGGVVTENVQGVGSRPLVILRDLFIGNHFNNVVITQVTDPRVDNVRTIDAVNDGFVVQGVGPTSVLHFSNTYSTSADRHAYNIRSVASGSFINSVGESSGNHIFNFQSGDDFTFTSPFCEAVPAGASCFHFDSVGRVTITEPHTDGTGQDGISFAASFATPFNIKVIGGALSSSASGGGYGFDATNAGGPITLISVQTTGDLGGVNDPGNVVTILNDATSGGGQQSSDLQGLLTLGSGISTDGGGFKHSRTTAGCATAATAGAACDATITWGTAFTDANYSVDCEGLGITSGVPLNGGTLTKIAASVDFRTVAATAVAAEFTNISCTAVHD